MADSDDIDRKYGATFCIYPWVQQMVTTQGEVQLCCSAVTSRLKTAAGEDLKVSNEGLGGAWNGPALREVRRRMLAGEKVPDCEHCDYLQSIGRKSWRQDANEGWFRWHNQDGSLERRVEASRAGLEVKEPPLYLDVRLGSKCNLGCRMCSPLSSDVVLKEHRRVATGSNSRHLRRLFFGATDVAAGAGSEWLDDARLWQDFDRVTDTVRRLTVAGGEPTLIEENYRLLEMCEQKGRCGEIDLIVNTNLTQLPDRFLRLVPRFRSFILMPSIDGVGKTQEYIRYPSRWHTIERNVATCFELLREHRNLRLSFSIVTQFLNVATLADYFQFIEERLAGLSPEEEARFDCSPIPLFLPSFYQIDVAPRRLRAVAAERLRGFSGKMRELPWVKSTVEATLRLCEAPQRPVSELVDFCIFNRELDRRRGIHLREYLPEVYEAVREEIDYDGVPLGRA